MRLGIDGVLVALLRERTRLAMQAGEIKLAHGEPVHAAASDTVSRSASTATTSSADDSTRMPHSSVPTSSPCGSDWSSATASASRS